MTLISMETPSARATTMIDGRERTYTVVGARESSVPRALILIFHGSRQSGEKYRNFTGRSFDILADSGRTVVAYLDGYKGNWNDARKESHFPARLEDLDDVAFTETVIGELKDSHGIDRQRVFIAGYSNGGQMVMRLVHQIGELLAGAMVQSATLPEGDDFMLPTPVPGASPLPVLLMHGTKDPIVPFRGGAMPRWAQRMFKVGGSALSMPDTAAYFARRNGVTAGPEVTELSRPADGRSGTWVEQTDYRDGNHPSVRLLTLHGAGHIVPGPKRAPFILGRTNRDVSAAMVAAEYFGL